MSKELQSNTSENIDEASENRKPHIPVFENTKEIKLYQPLSPIELLVYVPTKEGLNYYMEGGKEGLRLNRKARKLMDYNWNVTFFSAGENASLENIELTANKVLQKIIEGCGSDNPFIESARRSIKSHLDFERAKKIKEEILTSGTWGETISLINSKVLGKQVLATEYTQLSKDQKNVLTSIYRTRRQIQEKISEKPDIDPDEKEKVLLKTEQYLANHISSEIKTAGGKKIEHLQNSPLNRIIPNALDIDRFPTLRKFTDKTLPQVGEEIQKEKDSIPKENETKITQPEKPINKPDIKVLSMLKALGYPIIALAAGYITYTLVDLYQKGEISLQELREKLLSDKSNSETSISYSRNLNRELKKTDTIVNIPTIPVSTPTVPNKELMTNEGVIFDSNTLKSSLYQEFKESINSSVGINSFTINNEENKSISSLPKEQTNSYFMIGNNSIEEEGEIILNENLSKFIGEKGTYKFPVEPYPIYGKTLPQEFIDMFSNPKKYPYLVGIFGTDYLNHIVILGHTIEYQNYDIHPYNWLKKAYEEGGPSSLNKESFYFAEKDLAKLTIVDARELNGDIFDNSLEYREEDSKPLFFRLDQTEANGKKRGLGLPDYARKENQVTFIVCAGKYLPWKHQFEKILVVTTDITSNSEFISPFDKQESDKNSPKLFYR